MIPSTRAGRVKREGILRVVVLGTGTPQPDARHFGSSVLVEANGRKMMFDCGRGAVIRLSEAGVGPSEIDILYLTHLHSDHVVGIPDLWLTGWLAGRKNPLQIAGPSGTEDLTQHLKDAFQADLQMRESTENVPAATARIASRDVRPRTVYDDGSNRVTAFGVDHGDVKPALGYRVDYSGRSVVISGDTRFSENLIDFAEGTDCLIHSAWSVSSRNPTPGALRSIASAEDAARVFAAVKPGLAVIYHYSDSKGMAEAIRAKYRGPFVIAQDLMSIVIGDGIRWKNGSSSGNVQ